MNLVEVEGTTIDEAIDLALQRLGTTRDQVEVDIIASPTKGVLGIGGRKAKVRVSRRQPLEIDDESPPRPAPEPPPHERMSATVDPGFVDRAQSLLQEILEHMGFAVTVEARENDGTIELAIAGDSSGVLIGRHGQTLDALEYFVQRALGREDAATRISVDCEQYRVRRRATLESIAARLAQEAKNRRRAMTMEALSPRDRRIVHLTLQDEPGLTTRSSGDGHYRDLLIIPEGARVPSDRRDPRPPRPSHRVDHR